MTFKEFKKRLIDANITLPKFAKLIRVSEKNLQSYKQKNEIPNPIAVVVECFAAMEERGIDYRQIVDNLSLEKKSKKGGGFIKKEKSNEIDSEKEEA